MSLSISGYTVVIPLHQNVGKLKSPLLQHTLLSIYEPLPNENFDGHLITGNFSSPMDIHFAIEKLKEGGLTPSTKKQDINYWKDFAVIESSDPYRNPCEWFRIIDGRVYHKYDPILSTIKLHDWIIEPLQTDDIAPLLFLGGIVFPEERNILDENLKSSFGLSELDRKGSPSKMEISDSEDEIVSLKYFALRSNFQTATHIDSRNEKMVGGMIGLYEMVTDKEEADWLGWFLVDTLLRGVGLGKKLLDFAISASLQRGKKFLRLYTSDQANEKVAVKMYKKSGFELIKTESKGSWNQLTFELYLG